MLYTAVGAYVLLVGLGKAELYVLRPKILIKVIVGIIVVGWAVIFALMLLENAGIKILP